MSFIKGIQPILSLYRQILRIHSRQLPPPMRQLGDAYAREEFVRHLRGSTSHAQWVEFGIEWSKYLTFLRSDQATSSTTSGFTGDLEQELLERMTPEQLTQLQRLRAEALQFGNVVHKAGNDDK